MVRIDEVLSALRNAEIALRACKRQIGNLALSFDNGYKTIDQIATETKDMWVRLNVAKTKVKKNV